MSGILEISSDGEIGLEKLAIKKGNLIMFCKDDLSSLDKSISDSWPPFIIAKFSEWKKYDEWMKSTEAGIRLFTKQKAEPTIFSPSPKEVLKIFPPKEYAGLITLPNIYVGPHNTYHVNRAFVGKELILNQISKEEGFEFYQDFLAQYLS